MLFMAAACQDGYIDEIRPVDPGADNNAPAIAVGYPAPGVLLIPFTDTKAPVEFEFEVTDDIEITNIEITLNGSPLETYTEFTDFRRVTRAHLSDSLALGDYTFAVTATDGSGKSTTKEVDFEISNVYQAKYDGEFFYMPFEGNAYLDLLEELSATKVGNPGFAAGKSGRAYAGATNGYVTLPAAELINDEFSASFWYKVNAAPDRAGILTVSPPGPTNNNRTSGFRFFREGGATNQTFKLNVGNGTADVWVDGGAAASINPANTTGWIHLAFTISPTRAAVYIDGVMVKESVLTGLSWAGCDVFTIGSGAPNFTEWNHLSDLSLIDELRIFDKALTLEEVQEIFEDN